MEISIHFFCYELLAHEILLLNAGIGNKLADFEFQILYGSLISRIKILQISVDFGLSG